MDSLVSTQWLAEHLGEPDLVVVDSSWFMPSSGRSGRDEYLRAHIPGARFLDIDELSDRSSPAPHMLPGATQFGEAMERLGVGSGDRIVVYDNSPTRTAARGWFMFRHFGAERSRSSTAASRSGLPKGGRPKAASRTPRHARFEAVERDEVVTKQQLLAGAGLPWVDARGKLRFEGAEPDPRPGVSAGHAPGARNLPFGSLYREDGTLKPVDELRRLFAEAGVDPARPFVASCGSGVTANSLIFAAHLIGNDDAKLYDGSWSEWGADPATPKVLGPA